MSSLFINDEPGSTIFCKLHHTTFATKTIETDRFARNNCIGLCKFESIKAMDVQESLLFSSTQN